MTLLFRGFVVGVLVGFSIRFGEAAEFFPISDALFLPLVADPRELQYAVRAIVPVHGSFKGEAAMGDYFGVVQGRLPSDMAMQLNIGGGIFGRFDLEARTNDLEVADFYANLPVDFRRGRWSGRFMIYHMSSHLGDDFISRTATPVTKHAWDYLRTVHSWDATSICRLYAGASYAIRTLPKDDRFAVQGGFEMRSAWKRKHWRYYWANDWQSWQRVGWEPLYSSQMGLTWAPSAEHPKTATLFLEYTNGHQPHGQFYKGRESRWGLGVRLKIA